jgi:aminocarboxymuconate-semialdehyde decarboxylase
MNGDAPAIIDGAIDVHTHVYPRALDRWPIPAGAPHWPHLTCESDDRGTIRRGEAFYRTVDDRCWSLRRRLADMDRDGVAFQVLSPTPVSYAYDAPAPAADAHARALNEAIAADVRERPDRFAGLGTIALQDVDLACAEVVRLRRDLGLRGIQIGTIAGDAALDDPRFDSFWATCEREDAAVFIHPEATLAPERFERHRMVFSTAYPTETGTTAIALVMAGLFARYPALRVLLAHGGGTLPWLLPRVDRVWGSFAEVQAACPQRPSEVARRFWVDTLVYDPANVELLAARIGSEHLVLGSDYPFPIGEYPVGASVPDTYRKTARANALRLLESRR